MTRDQALRRLHQRLLAHRADLEEMYRHDTEGTADPGFGSGDAGDLANEDTEREIRSQLASIESDELFLVRRALNALREGRYGQCERCSRPISIARLEALPHTTRCIECQQSAEHPRKRRKPKEDWEKVSDLESRQQERDLTLDQMDVDVD